MTERTPRETARDSGIFPRIRGKLLVGIALGGLVYVGLSIYTGYGALAQALAQVRWLVVPLLLALSFLNYLLRFLKWDYYLDRLAIPVRRRDSLAIFFSGLVMVVTPGKMGELLKAYLLRRVEGTPVSKSAPIVVAERLTDFIALILLSAVGIGAYSLAEGRLVLLVTLGGTAGFLLLVAWRGACLRLIGRIERTRPLARLGRRLRVAYESIYTMVGPRCLAWATVLSVGAWFCECLGLWITLRFFLGSPNLLTATFIYAISTIAGAISMIPGGLGTTEAFMNFLLQKLMSVPLGPATAATFIIRVATLWFAVVLGAVVLAANQRRFAGVGEIMDREGGSSGTRD